MYALAFMLLVVIPSMNAAIRFEYPVLVLHSAPTLFLHYFWENTNGILFFQLKIIFQHQRAVFRIGF